MRGPETAEQGSMTYQEALDYLSGTQMAGGRLGLDRVRALLSRLEHPEQKLRFVHVAGTNGKGSTAALLDSCLRQAGYRVGLYTSPHLTRYNERFRVNGVPISDGTLAEIMARVKSAADRMTESPSQFELLTCAAFLCFLEAGCEIVVLEVGLGGRLDATNVIPVPEAAVITRIGLDHTEMLGSTIEAIAREKAGIVKPGGTVVLGDRNPAVTEEVAEICRRQGADLRLARPPCALTQSLEGQLFAWGPYPELRLSLLGPHQLQNAAAALETLEILRSRGWRISPQALRAGLASAVWPGRLELAARRPDILIDGGHNPQCAEAAAEALRVHYPGKKCRFLLGVLADKDVDGILRALLPLAEEVAAVTPQSSRALPAEHLCQRLEKSFRFRRASAYASPAQALEALRRGAGPEDVICVCGSLYMIGEVREALGLR